MKDECDVCGKKLPLVEVPRKDGLIGAKTVAVVGMAMDVMTDDMCEHYQKGQYVVCRNCVLAALGVHPNKVTVLQSSLFEEPN